MDAIITIKLYLATCFGRNRPSSGQVIWPENGRLRQKHVAKYNLIVIIASSLDVCCVLTVHDILYNLIYRTGCPLSDLRFVILREHFYDLYGMYMNM